MMLSSSKRKFNDIEETDLIAPEVKRGKVSERCDLSSLYLNENIPHNMQKLGGTDDTAVSKVLESAGMKQSLDDVNEMKEQKPSRNSRLNLKKRREVRNKKNKEVETESCLKNECSSMVTDKQCADKVGDQEDEKDSESALKCLGHDGHLDVQCCPICRNDISLLESDTELNTHINNCLDNATNDSTKSSTSSTYHKEFFFCEICKRDISGYNTVQRQQHYNRCCDSIGESLRKAVAAQKQLSCLICGKMFKTLKSRQSHMKRCAKIKNVSTTQLVELNRNEGFVSGPGSVQANGTKAKERRNKRKKNTRLLGKNMDDETQLAIALSASLQSNEKDNKDLEKRSKKKHKGQTEIPALLLRNDIEMRKVTEARAAAVLCHWADSDEDIQCTPALAPSSLFKKNMSSNSETDTQSVDVTHHLEPISEYSEEDFAEKIENEDMDVSISNLERESDNVIKKNAAAEKANEISDNSALSIVKKDDSNEKTFIIDKDARLWRISSLCAENLSESNFYVRNLLPKTTPRKKKLVGRSSFHVTEEHKVCHTVSNEENDGNQVSPVKTSNENDGITESQEIDIQQLAELVGEERSDDIQSNVDERENEVHEETWYHSSGFCVTRDIHGHEEEKKKNIEILLDDLSSMVGNRVLSDVKILAKNKQQYFAHSFMLATRCSTLAKMINEKRCDSKDDSNSNFITLEMMDVDVRAVHAVMTYIYTASYVPVSHYVITDVKTLAQRLNLNCDVHAWEDLNEGVHRDNEDLLDCEDDLELDGTEGDQQATDLDVLLKSLWEGEDITENTAEEEEDAFGDSVLGEDMNDMEIKIYTQVTPKKTSGSTEETSGVGLNKECIKVKEKSFIEESLLHVDSDEDIAGESMSECRGEDFPVQKIITQVSEGSNCGDTEEINMENEDGDNSGESDGWFVPQTPRRPALDLSRQKSRMKYEHKIQALNEVIFEDVAEPKIATTLTRKQQEKQQCCGDASDSHVRAFKPPLSSDVNDFSHTCPLTPQRSSSLNRSHVSNSLSRHSSSNPIHCLSPLSPVGVIVSPTSPQSVFSEQNNGNFTMDIEDGDVRKSEELECDELVNCELQTASETSLNITENTKKSLTEDLNVDCERDVSFSSSIPRNISSPAECVSGKEHDLNDDCFGNPYDDQDFYCYDDGGFNCDIVDYLDTSCKLDTDSNCNATEMEHEETEEPVVKEVQSKAGSCKVQVRDDRDERNVSKRNQTAGNKRQQLEPQTSGTPMLDYSNMDTPDLKVELKQYGVRPLPKRKMVVKLKEIYQFTHRDTSSESEIEDQNHEMAAEFKKLKEKPKVSKAPRNDSDEGSSQDSGKSSDSSGGFSDDELTKDDDVLSQESSLNLSKKLMRCLTQNNELYLRILKYEPVVLSSIEEILKHNKIKCSAAKLKDFLDEQCITFTEPRPVRARKKTRRANAKSQKSN